MNRNMKELFDFYVDMYEYVIFDAHNTKEIIDKGKEYQIPFLDCMKVRRKLINYYEEN